MTDPIADFIVRALLRYFRAGRAVAARAGGLRESDRDLLLLHWAISPEIMLLVQYLEEHPHEIQAALETRRVISYGQIRGRLNASETVLAQARSSDATVFALDEPFRSRATGPNRLLTWTLSYATMLARRFREILPTESTYHARVTTSLKALQAMGSVLMHEQLPSQSLPTAADIRVARTSRVNVYRKAAAAYDLLQAVRRLDPAALQSLMNATLVGPLERWRQYEIALAIAMADALARALGYEARLRRLLPGASDILIEIGPYAIRWQRSGPTFSPFKLDDWEQREATIVGSYGISPGYDRPDIVLFERASGAAVAIGEAKYFENDDWTDRLREAVGQVVNYARGHARSADDVDVLIGKSIIALWTVGDRHAPTLTDRAPFVATFKDFGDGLDAWAKRVTSGRSAPPLIGNGSS